jgi:hypothetical protein
MMHCDPKAHKPSASQEHNKSHTSINKVKWMLSASTKRYLLKPIISIATYYHSMLRRTASKRPEDVPRITTQLVLFFLIDIWQKLFVFVNVRHCIGVQETKAASGDARPNSHPKHGANAGTKRYLLQPIILIITYIHSGSWKPSCVTEGLDCPPHHNDVTTQYVW